MATENSIKVIKTLQANGNADVTAKDVAEMAGVSIQAVTGSFNALVKKGLGYREEVEVQDAETEKISVVKYLKLTPEGMTYDPEAVDAAKAKAAKAE